MGFLPVLFPLLLTAASPSWLPPFTHLLQLEQFTSSLSFASVPVSALRLLPALSRSIWWLLLIHCCHFPFLASANLKFLILCLIVTLIFWTSELLVISSLSFTVIWRLWYGAYVVFFVLCLAYSVMLHNWAFNAFWCAAENLSICFTCFGGTSLGGCCWWDRWLSGVTMKIAKFPNKFHCKFFPMRLASYIVNYEMSSLKTKFHDEF